MLSINRRGRGFLKDGSPFFWLGDTAWLLFSKLSDAEIETYLTNRAAKGYTVIQATLSHFENYAAWDGSPAFIGNDLATPAEDSPYWARVERTVALAARLGLVMALLPCWGSFAKTGRLNAENAPLYGAFLARRFGRFENVLWLLGGDVRGSDAPESFEALARALRRGAPNQLIGFHPFGRCSSSQWFAGADWLDFHMFQSGHRDRTQRRLGAWDDNEVSDEEWMAEENYLYVFRDLARDDKPTLDGEPSYEDIPHGLHDASKPYWTDRQVRRYAWWCLLAGGAGFTYGHNAIMQFWRGDEEGSFGVRQRWDVALHAPGSFQMRHLRRLMEAVDWQEGENAQGCLTDDSGTEDARNLAFITPRALVVYCYGGAPFGVRLETLPFESAAFWYSPKLGGLSPMMLPADGVFVPPADTPEALEDWALVLADKKTAPNLVGAIG
ncbi:MAG: DUF4038 domain-containing protein [Clostridia bacterium]|nr:DUF4038 domain-containing protein [Clostridia bacterium]